MVAAHEITARLKSIALTRSDIIAVYLYGSYANGTARVTSDVDVAVLFSTAVPDPLKAELALNRELSVLPGLAKVEVIALNRATLRLKAEVLQTGIRVHSSDEEVRTEFEFNAMREWWDCQPWHETYNKIYFATLKENFSDEQRRAYQRARQALALAD